MISHLLNSFLIGILFVEMLERRFPEQCRKVMISLSYNCIYYYSKAQILFIKYVATNPLYVKMMETIESKTKTTKNELDFLFIKDNFQYIVPIDLPDLIITSDLSKTPIPKRITYKGDYKNVRFEESDIKFMLIEFKVGEKAYKIDLKTDLYNYYIVGNKFTKEFFIFYINNYLITKSEQNEALYHYKCTLEILDHNVNKVVIDFTDKNESIELDKNAYMVNNIHS